MRIPAQVACYGIIFFSIFLSQADPVFWERVRLSAGSRSVFQPIDLAATLRRIRGHGAPPNRVVIVDARPSERFSAGHIPGAQSLPEIPRGASSLAAFAKADEVIVYCDNALCSRADVVAERIGRLVRSRVCVYEGGWEEWASSGLPVER
jgi:rhodanese-related sulfurtransferase